MTSPATLSLLEARVIGVLIEKERSVPDIYPMSVNALTAGCNQRTSRSPVMNVSEAEVLQTIDSLNARSLIIESSGGRVMRYAHNAGRALGLPSQSLALLATLILRGPQTAAELRTNSERLHRFADISAVEAFLQELAERPAGALVATLPRTPGTRETRWMQLLTGAAPTHASDPEATVSATSDADPLPRSVDGALAARVDSLRADVDTLKQEVADLKRQQLERRG
jgi:uncharacterized protein YceH (UPF0502 family)